MNILSEDLFKNIEDDYDSINQNGLYIKDMYDYPLSDNVLDSLIKWYKKIKEEKENCSK